MGSGAGNRLRAGLGLALVLLLAGTATASAGGSTPTDPIPFTRDSPALVDGAAADYWLHVPESYEVSHHTPTRLLVWLHGCGGFSSGDIWNVRAGEGQFWISVAPTGREGSCWQPGADQAEVLASVNDVSSHFNIDPRRVFLGGYSSGGDLSYRTAFHHANRFAGILVENTTPFRDTGSSREDSLAAASWKFNVAHLAHNQDTTYPIETVDEETGAMIEAGFPLDLIRVDGTHYDDPGAIVNGAPVPGTTADLRTYLLPLIEGDWQSPEITGPGPMPGPGPGPGDPPGPDPDPDPAVRPKVKIRSAPARRARSRQATFRFRSSVAGAATRCRIDGGRFRRCRSPKRYRGLRAGRHTFRVKAIAGGLAGHFVPSAVEHGGSTGVSMGNP